jgi:hypothetical protein
MKNKKCKKCKNICAECEHYIEQNCRDEDECALTKKEIIDCVDGETKTVYKLCKDLNNDGKCKKFKMDKRKERKRKLLAALDEYEYPNGKPHYPGPSYYANVENTLIYSLRECLENNGECEDFEITYDYDEDSGDVIYLQDPRVKETKTIIRKKKHWWS